MSFSEQLRKDADTIFQAIRQHPFIQDIAQERLSREASASQLEDIQAIFNDGCRLEYRFFDTAYKQETWSPTETVGSVAPRV